MSNVFKDQMTTITPPVESQAPVIYYDGSRYLLDSGERFIPIDQRSAIRHLKRSGIAEDEVEEEVCQIQTDGFVDYAGPLAGHSRGVHEAGGQRLLATSSPSVIQPGPGSWPTLKAVVTGLLGDDPEAGNRQVETFLGWLKFARQSLTNGNRRPGQALALAGPRQCGKSLLIDLIELAMGGRRGNPYPHFSGRTSFNGDLAGVELLAVDDDCGSSQIAARRHLAASIKSSLFAGSVRIEDKGKRAFTFKPCWRMVLAVNDEPEALMVLPPITEDLADKLILLHCHKRPLPMPAYTEEEREAFFAKLTEEMPAMLRALEAWDVPQELKEERCGIAHYHHPVILRALVELSPEGQLIGLVDALTTDGLMNLPWTGTASELKSLLVTSDATRRDAEKLLGGWTAAPGVYLGRLEGHRAQKLVIGGDGIQRWRVLPPRTGDLEMFPPSNAREEKA